jgi:glycosyltransferase involved in cell wall biosynthesis
MSSRAVLIIEPLATGHRPVWLQWMSRELLAHGWSVTVATLRRSAAQPGMAWLAGPLPPGLSVLRSAQPPVPETGTRTLQLMARELRYHRLLAALCAEARRAGRFDAVLLPFGDYAMHATAVLGSPFAGLPWVTVLLRPSFHHAAAGVRAPSPSLEAARRSLFRRFVATASLKTCFSIDRPLVEAHGSDSRPSAKLRYLPDPVDDIPKVERVAARGRLGVPSSAVVVLVYGSLGIRKGLQYLLPAVSAANRPELRVLVAGRVDDYTAQLLREPEAAALRAASRLIVHDGWADESLQAELFAAVDVMWLGYWNHWQSSGVLAQAARAGLASIACDAGLTGWMAGRAHCAEVVPVERVDAVAAALQRLADSPPLRARLGRNGQEAFHGHSPEIAGSLIAAALAQASGAP